MSRTGAAYAVGDGLQKFWVLSSITAFRQEITWQSNGSAVLNVKVREDQHSMCWNDVNKNKNPFMTAPFLKADLNISPREIVVVKNQFVLLNGDVGW